MRMEIFVSFRCDRVQAVNFTRKRGHEVEDRRACNFAPKNGDRSRQGGREERGYCMEWQNDESRGRSTRKPVICFSRLLNNCRCLVEDG